MKSLFLFYMKSLILFLFISLSLSGKYTAHAQAHTPKNSAEIYLDLQRLNTLGTVLYIAAHPDDENTRLLSWFVGEKKFRTAYVSLTRGDGGQNLIGSELGTLLGVIRTQELLAARRIDGAEQYFTRAYDFGYSKNPEETLQKWNEDSLLKDLVVLIRQIQPDIIICRFPPNSLAGHGHHSSSAILGEKAFHLAGDQNYMVNGLAAWQPQRLFWNTYQFSSGTNTTSEDQIKINVGTYNAILGQSYGEISSISRSQHKSQGFGSATTRGDNVEYFVQLEGDSVEHDLTKGLVTDWSRIPKSENLQILIDRAISQYQVDKPTLILPTLLEIKKSIEFLQRVNEQDIAAQTWLNYKLSEVHELIRRVAGIWTLTTVPTNVLSPGDTVEANFEWIHRADIPVKLNRVVIGNQLVVSDTMTNNNQLLSVSKKVRLSQDVSYSRPYWLERPIQNNLFQAEDDVHGNAAEILKDQLVQIHYSVGGQDLYFEQSFYSKTVDPVAGEQVEPIVILPAVTMKWSSPFSIHPNGEQDVVQLQVNAHTDIQGGELILDFPQSWKVEVQSRDLPQMKKGESHQFVLSISNASATDVKDTLNAAILIEGQEYDLQLYDIDYSHIPRQSVLIKSQISLTSFEIKTQIQKIGYLDGVGDWVPPSLEQLGYEIVPITAENYKSISWTDLDAVVTGIRAYNTHEWLNDAYDDLMSFVENGGNLIVQYNTNNFFGPLIAKMFPYELEITRARVTVEEAPVTFIDKKSPILQHPNVITAKDFDGWIQERGIYFAGKRSKAWKSVLSMNDPNEPPLDGSLVWAPYGKGHLVYTGLVFFRQLPAGVPGAYRLLVNLIELGK